MSVDFSIPTPDRLPIKVIPARSSRQCSNSVLSLRNPGSPFGFDIFEKLLLDVHASGQRLTSAELSITTVFPRPPFAARLQVANSAILGTGNEAKHGSILDVDVSLGSLDFDLFENGLEKFSDGHQLEKQIFFGLLKPDFLATLNPVYE